MVLRTYECAYRLSRSREKQTCNYFQFASSFSLPSTLTFPVETSYDSAVSFTWSIGARRRAVLARNLAKLCVAFQAPSCILPLHRYACLQEISQEALPEIVGLMQRANQVEESETGLYDARLLRDVPIRTWRTEVSTKGVVRKGERKTQTKQSRPSPQEARIPYQRHSAT